jgi:hypothetical protein
VSQPKKPRARGLLFISTLAVRTAAIHRESRDDSGKCPPCFVVCVANPASVARPLYVFVLGFLERARHGLPLPLLFVEIAEAVCAVRTPDSTTIEVKLQGG